MNFESIFVTGNYFNYLSLAEYQCPANTWMDFILTK
jgi:hypothetical protein